MHLIDKRLFSDILLVTLFFLSCIFCVSIASNVLLVLSLLFSFFLLHHVLLVLLHVVDIRLFMRMGL